MEFSRQELDGSGGNRERLAAYIDLARGYADVEGVLAVLSDLQERSSYVVHGRFSKTLDIDSTKCSGKISSIWEQEIFNAIHTDDLKAKMLQELLFFHHVTRLPHGRRFNQCLMQRLRMRTRTGRYVDVLHRLHYIPANDGRSVWLALCLYGAMPQAFNLPAAAIDMLTGQTMVLDRSSGRGILSRQETSVLKLIDSGKRSCDIASMLNISIHTVSRHRQNIIAKLQVRNSTEACRIARALAIF